MKESQNRIALWDNIKFLLIYLVVLGHFASFYLEQSWNMKRLFLCIYFFHMPAFLYISGVFSKNKVNQKKYRKVFEYFVLFLFIKGYLFLIKILCGYGVSNISLLSEGGVPWYAFVLAVYVLITSCLKNLNRKYLFLFSIILACFAGYDSSLGKELVLSRIIVYYPFFLAGYYSDEIKVTEKLRKTKAKAFFGVSWFIFLTGVCLGIKKIYWLSPLLSGQNPYASLGKAADFGGLLRAGYYVIAFLLIFGLISLVSEKECILSRIGSRSVQVYALHYGAVYLFFGRFSGIKIQPIWIFLISLAVTLIFALPFWGRMMKPIIKPKWREEEE